MAGRRPAKRSAGDDGARAAQAYDTVQRKRLDDLQRARILSAVFDVAAERGAGNMTVAHVVERSGVSRRTFYEHFTDREDCFLAAFEQALVYASRRVLPAYKAERSWRGRMRAGLIALLCFLDEEPRVGRVLIVESLAGGPRALARRTEAIAKLTRAVEAGAAEPKTGSTPPPLTGEGVVGGVLAVLQERLAKDARAPLIDLANPLMSMIVLPYLGSAAARRELDRSVPAPAGGRQNGVLLSNPFNEVGMRLTYRTVRVLVVIAEHPDASNRLIGDAAGITDQGQISKLLGRLERNGLIENTHGPPAKGAPNSWALTEKGRRLTDGIRAHSGTCDEPPPELWRSTATSAQDKSETPRRREMTSSEGRTR